MQPVRKPTWQQATALVSLSTCGAVTGFAFAHGTVDDMTSPTRMPVHLLALDKPARAASASDSALRSAIVTAARNYLRMAQTKSPAEMQALIWGNDSTDGADHGEWCAAFASLTLALGAQASGQQSWVAGGASYPWPLHPWADVRVNPNPASLQIISILQDAQAHNRWHPLGDGYQPQPGDWAMFDGHVEVITGYSGGVLETIGGDSAPNLSVNAHQFTGPPAAQGVTGFVDNGDLPAGASQAPAGAGGGVSQIGTTAQVEAAGVQGQPAPASAGQAAIPGTQAAAGAGAQARKGTARMASTASAAGRSGTASGAGPGSRARAGSGARSGSRNGSRATPGPGSRGGRGARAGAADIPGLETVAVAAPGGASAPSYTRSNPPASATRVPDTLSQQAFISQIVPGAMAAQSRYGIPAAVTIAQAIDESGWGQSALAIRDHNLFGIKGTGPAGSDVQPTQEYQNGQWVTVSAPFRVYHNVAESIADHGQLLATGPSYQQAMADRHHPDAFATDLTGVYATDPQYGSNLIALMRLYNLYQYDASSQAAPQAPGAGTSLGAGTATIPGVLDAVPASPAPASPAPASQARTSQARTSHADRGPAPRVTSRRGSARASQYVPQIPGTVTTAFISTAKAPLSRAKPLYQDVAGYSGIRWQLLAACDWMQCQAQPRYSPVHGEKLGTVNADRTVYRTRSGALEQCASDLIELAMAVYWIDVTARRPLSVRDLARVFAAFRWGGLLKLHGVSAMEFPYSVAGLTAQHTKMRWPDIKEPNAPDRPGTRFRAPFGAVPVALCLGYPATA